MSMIADALKKAETSSEKTPPIPPSQKSLWLYRATLIAAVGIVLIGLAQMTHRPAAENRAARTRAPEARGRNTAAAPAPSRAGGLLPKTSGTPLFQGGPALTGIVLDNHGESLALVDNQIVKEGEVVRDMTVLKVNPDSVELQGKDGKTKTLKLND